MTAALGSLRDMSASCGHQNIRFAIKQFIYYEPNISRPVPPLSLTLSPVEGQFMFKKFQMFAVTDIS